MPKAFFFVFLPVLVLGRVTAKSGGFYVKPTQGLTDSYLQDCQPLL